MLNQCLVASITKILISYSLVLGLQPFIDIKYKLCKEMSQYILKPETFSASKPKQTDALLAA